MATYEKELSRQTVLFTDATNVPTSTPVVSSWIRLPRRDVTYVKTHTTGTYTLTLDWSNDGTNVAFTTTATPSNNTPATVVALAPYLRVTITATVSNFTAHRTNVAA